MKLMTKEIENRIPALYFNDGKDAATVKIHVKFFSPYGSGVWYATEYDPESQMFFGFAQMFPGGGELGYFSADELKSVRGSTGIPIVRDINFGDHTLREVMDGARP